MGWTHQSRPEQGRTHHTPVPGLFLGGDWTRTGLPATIEDAVKNGYIAAAEAFNAIRFRYGYGCQAVAKLHLRRPSYLLETVPPCGREVVPST
ncbi:MAG: FAD-dependent oxidoreductase [Terriglobia bacterium]